MSRLFIMCLLSIAPLFCVANPFLNASQQTRQAPFLFEVHGSNTVGAALIPMLLTAWLEMRGLTEIEHQPSQVQNESTISARTLNGKPVRIFIAAHGSTTGFEALTPDRRVFAASSRPAKLSERDQHPGLTATVLAIDGIAIVVNPSVRAESLTMKQVGQLFSGELTNWEPITGQDLPLSIFARDENSGTYDTFKNLVLNRGYLLSARAQRFESNAELIERVNKTPGAIGFAPVSYTSQAKTVAVADGDGQAMYPQQANIATEDYALSRRLYLYQTNTDPFMADFSAFAESATGQDLALNAGFISQNIQALEWTLSGDLPAGYELIGEHAMRINTNFRFQEYKNEPDEKAMADIERLVAFMKLPGNQQRKLFLIGFADQQKNEFKARLLSEARVMAIKHELSRRGLKTEGYSGYGQINPVAANQGGGVSLRNQRVEVWIR